MVKRNLRRNYRFGLFTACIALRLTTGSYSQENLTRPNGQSISQTGLLPIYGVDLAVDAAWVDGVQFPSQSAGHPNYGVNAAFQQVWDALKSSGFNTVRFPVDVRDAQGGPNQVANLCIWAKNNNVRLVPILIGAGRGQPVGVDYASKVSAFVKGLLTALRGEKGENLESYKQILAYQLEDEMNHPGLHGAMLPQSAQLRLLQAASALRKAEQDGPKAESWKPTPLMVSASFDCELIKARAMAGVTLGDDAYAKAYASLKQFLVELAASAEIDMIGVDWFAGSVSAGSAEKFPTLLRSVAADLPGKQIVFLTGSSTGFRPAEDQRTFYAVAFANLADYRASEGVDSPFIGVFFHEALNGPEANPPAPTPNLLNEMKEWDWATKADDLVRLWNGEAKSDALVWWEKKVENNMGLLSLKPDSKGNATVITQPAQEGLNQIAAAIEEANTNAAATADESVSSTKPARSPSAAGATDSRTDAIVKERFQQGMMALLDRAFERLGNMISGTKADASDAGRSSPGGTAEAISTSSIDLLPEETGAPTPDETPPVKFSLVNPEAFAISKVKASLLLDGKAVQTKTVAKVWPNGSRSILFNNLPGKQSGKHDVKVVWEGPGAKLLKGAITRPPKISAKAATPTDGSVRSVLPPEFKVGKLAVPAVGGTRSNAMAAAQTNVHVKPGVGSPSVVGKKAPPESGAEPCCEIKPNPELKGRLGRVVVIFPKDAKPYTHINVCSATEPAKTIGESYGEFSADLFPGQYIVYISGKRVSGVEVRERNDTRVRAGVLNIHLIERTYVEVFDQDNKQKLAESYGAMEAALPPGKVNVHIAGQFQPAIIKDGQVTDF